MLKKLLPYLVILIPFIIAAIFFIGLSVFAAPIYNVQRSLIPETDNLFYVGSTSPAVRWGGLYVGDAASSTILGNLGIGTTTAGTVLSVQGVGNFQPGTSTLYSGLVVPSLTATSGIAITGGCYKTPDGNCLVAGTISGTGNTDAIAYWTSGTALAATSTLTVNSIYATSTSATNEIAGNVRLALGAGTNVGVATATPGALFSVNGEGLFSGGLRAPFFVSTSTSLFQGGVTITCTDCITDANVINTITLDNITQITNRAITDLTGTLTVSNGGTGVATLNSFALLVGNGTGAVTATSSPTIGYLYASSTTQTSYIANKLGIATSSPDTGTLEVKGDIFFKGQAYGEWVALDMTQYAPTFDCSLGNRFKGTVSKYVVIPTPTNCKAGHTAIIQIQEDSTGGRRIEFATSSIVNSQYASTTANAVNWFGIMFDGDFGYILAATSTNPTN